MINISKENAELFEKNGFSKEKVKATVEHYRQQGMSDEDIQLKINTQIANFNNSQQANTTSSTPSKSEKRGIDLTPSGIVKNSLATVLAPIRGAMYGEDYQTARENALGNVEKFKPAKGAGDFLVDMAVYSKLPMLKGAGAGNFLGNAAIQGGVPAALESLKRGGNAVEGAGVGTGIAAALQGITPQAGKVISKVLESNAVQKGLPKILEGLTSVPAEYSERALEKEIAGNSILNGKFDADSAYIPIERKLRQAKEMLPSSADFGNEYYKLGQKALEGMENLKSKAGAEIDAILEPLNNKEIANGGLQNAVNSIIESFGKGGVYNSAKSRAKNVLNFLEENLNKEGLTLRDLHRIKGDLYDIGYTEAGNKNGVGADVARGVANQINNYLRRVSPSYAKPNDVYSTVIEAIRGLEGNTTLGGKLSDIGSVNSAKSGLDQRLKAIDNLLPQQNKFYKQAEDIINNEKEINNIVNMVGKQYERNPRLLANRTDEAFENAINDLQSKTGTNFMEELTDTRAREALERFFPGQGGGSGSSQGFGNLLRTALIGGSPVAAVTMHNPAALAGLALVSPKLTAKGTIKNIGKLSETAKKAASGAYEDILNRLTQLGAKGVANMLYGGVEYNNYR